MPPGVGIAHTGLLLLAAGLENNKKNGCMFLGCAIFIVLNPFN